MTIVDSNDIIDLVMKRRAIVEMYWTRKRGICSCYLPEIGIAVTIMKRDGATPIDDVFHAKIDFLNDDLEVDDKWDGEKDSPDYKPPVERIYYDLRAAQRDIKSYLNKWLASQIQ